ncbi:hypothetical protein [Streptomyces sp. NPDC056600]|uniref:hypothetical protein n=1 Tax=Streptomyces sp. NPDC056600 TaxID=3345874 RepID=UPI0036A0F57F
MLASLACFGCGPGAGGPGGEAAGRSGPRTYDGCSDGRSLEEIERAYGLGIPEHADNLRFCEQEEWSGSDAEVQFDTSRDGLRTFLVDSGQPDLALFDGTYEGEGREWQALPEGEPMEGGSYSNRIGDCDNSVTVRVQTLQDDEVRVYLSMACAS